MAVQTIPVAEFWGRIQRGEAMNIIDVRTPGEFAQLRVAGARSMPLDGLDAAAVAAQRKGDEPVYVICQSGGRSAKACAKLEGAGLEKVYSIDGGTAAWAQMGLPVVRGKGKVISLERQVRIAAGGLMFAGALLGWLVHPGFLGVPLFVGAGLVFAGVTDFCGMGIVLGKMPWNR